MPHRSFGAARITQENEPITFDFGAFGEETFTVVPNPSIGDSFDLYDLPEISPETMNLPQLTRGLSKFIRRMLPPEDRRRYDEALYRIPSSQMFLITELAVYIAEEVTKRPFTVSASSSGGLQSSGTS